MSEPVQLDVVILGRQYKVTCRPEEQTELLAAVGYLDGKMREIRDTTKAPGIERISVMAGLNIAHELLRARSSSSFDSEDFRRRIVAMQVAVDQAMVQQDQLF
jgi:cell division protein ZapA